MGTLNWMNGFNMTKSGILTVTTKSRNFHSGVPPGNSQQHSCARIIWYSYLRQHNVLMQYFEI